MKIGAHACNQAKGNTIQTAKKYLIKVISCRVIKRSRRYLDKERDAVRFKNRRKFIITCGMNMSNNVH